MVIKMNEYIDLTVTLSKNYLPYPGDAPIGFKQVKTIDADGYNLTRIETGMHIGTHIDARKHILPDGEGIESLEINELIGQARVLRPTVFDGVISSGDIIEGLIGDETILLLDLKHTSKLNTDAYYEQPRFLPGIVPYLAAAKIKVIGFDIPSPEYVSGDFLDMHRDLMKAGIHIIENLTNLELLTPVVDFIGLPLKIEGMDGSLMRCVAKKNVMLT